MVMFPRTLPIAHSTVPNSILAPRYNPINTLYSTLYTEDKEINLKYNVLSGNYCFT